MIEYAIKMLLGDRAKYIGLLLGLSFAAFIMTQQAAIFVGLMTRTYGFIADTSQADIWVMDPNVLYADDIKTLKETDLDRVKSLDGILWACPLYKGLLKAELPSGKFQSCIVVGIDGASLIGQPPKILEGNIERLKGPDAVIVNRIGTLDKLATKGPDGKNIPMKMGDVFELNDHRVEVVGIADVRRTFQSQPVIYTTYQRVRDITSCDGRTLTFILVKGAPGINLESLSAEIQRTTGLKALTQAAFEKLTVDYYLRYTGIPINFGVAVLLGFIIGAAIAGQTFYNFTLDHLRYFAAYKAMGASDHLLAKMVATQAAWVGLIGWGLGIGAASLFGLFTQYTELSFRLPWELFLLSGFAMFFLSFLSAYISIKRLKHIDLAMVFR